MAIRMLVKMRKVTALKMLVCMRTRDVSQNVVLHENKR